MFTFRALSSDEDSSSSESDEEVTSSPGQQDAPQDASSTLQRTASAASHPLSATVESEGKAIANGGPSQANQRSEDDTSSSTVGLDHGGIGGALTGRESEEVAVMTTYKRSLVLCGAGDFEKAEPLLLHILNSPLLRAKSVPAQLTSVKFASCKMLAAIYTRNDKNHLAIDLLTQALDIVSNDVTLWMRLCRVAKATKQYDLALSAAVSALDLNPGYWPALDEAVLLSFTLVRFEACLEFSCRALSKDRLYEPGIYSIQRILTYQPCLKPMIESALKLIPDLLEYEISFEETDKLTSEVDEIKNYIRAEIAAEKGQKLEVITFSEPLAKQSWSNLASALDAKYKELNSKGQLGHLVNLSGLIPPNIEEILVSVSETQTGIQNNKKEVLQEAPVKSEAADDFSVVENSDEQDHIVPQTLEDENVQLNVLKPKDFARFDESLIEKRRSVRTRTMELNMSETAIVTEAAEKEISLDLSSFLSRILPDKIKEMSSAESSRLSALRIEREKERANSNADKIRYNDKEDATPLKDEDPVKIVSLIQSLQEDEPTIIHITLKFLRNLAPLAHFKWPGDMVSHFVSLFTLSRSALPSAGFDPGPTLILPTLHTFLLNAEIVIDRKQTQAIETGIKHESPCLGDYIDFQDALTMLDWILCLEEDALETKIIRARVVWIRYVISFLKQNHDDVKENLEIMKECLENYGIMKIHRPYCTNGTFISVGSIHGLLSSLEDVCSTEVILEHFNAGEMDQVVSKVRQTLDITPIHHGLCMELGDSDQRRQQEFALLHDAEIRLAAEWWSDDDVASLEWHRDWWTSSCLCLEECWRRIEAFSPSVEASCGVEEEGGAESGEGERRREWIDTALRTLTVMCKPWSRLQNSMLKLPGTPSLPEQTKNIDDISVKEADNPTVSSPSIDIPVVLKQDVDSEQIPVKTTDSPLISAQALSLCLSLSMALLSNITAPLLPAAGIKGGGNGVGPGEGKKRGKGRPRTVGIETPVSGGIGAPQMPVLVPYELSSEVWIMLSEQLRVLEQIDHDQIYVSVARDPAHEMDLTPSLAVLHAGHDFVAHHGAGKDAAQLLKVILTRCQEEMPSSAGGGDGIQCSTSSLMTSSKEVGVTSFPGDVKDVEDMMEQAAYCLVGLARRVKGHQLDEHPCEKTKLDWPTARILLNYFKPETLPEFDSVKTMSISADLLLVFTNALTLIPVSELANGCSKDDILQCLQCEQDPFKLEYTSSDSGDIFYLIADYHMKNNEFKEAIEFYIEDLRFNPRRFDTWAALALIFSNQLEEILNLTNEDTEDLNEAMVVKCFRCFEIALSLDTDNGVTLRIEQGSLAYAIYSYASKIIKKSNTREYPESLITRCQGWSSYMLSMAKESYSRALVTEDGGEEAWLLHYMLAKIDEKSNTSSLLETLSMYNKSAESLDAGGAKYPKKITLYNKIPYRSVEAIEVFYKSHALALKTLMKQNTPTLFPIETLSQLETFLLERAGSSFAKRIYKPSNRQSSGKRKRASTSAAKANASNPEKRLRGDAGMVFSSGRGTAGSGDESDASETETGPLDNAGGPSGVPLPGNREQEEIDSDVRDCVDQIVEAVVTEYPEPDPAVVWDSCWKRCISLCMDAMEIVLQRLPLHYKAIYYLAHAHFFVKHLMNVNKCLEILLGSKTGNKTPYCLFKDRKQANFFHGVWRIPMSDIDRSGNFANHMFRCVNLLLSALRKVGDWRQILQLHSHLRKPPAECNIKLHHRKRLCLFTLARKGFLSESDRIFLSRRAFGHGQFALREWLQLEPGPLSSEILLRVAKTRALAVKLGQGVANMNNLLILAFSKCPEANQGVSGKVAVDEIIRRCGVIYNASKEA